MKRDMDLIRTIALELEANESSVLRFDNGLPCASVTDAHVLGEHLDLMRDAKLMTSERWVGYAEGTPQHSEIKLTWAGHEFINAVRDQGIWNKVQAMAEKAGSWTVPILVELGSREVKRQLGLGA